MPDQLTLQAMDTEIRDLQQNTDDMKENIKQIKKAALAGLNINPMDENLKKILLLAKRMI